MKLKNIEIEKLKIAITHDYLIEYGGAERVLLEMLEIFPNAHLYTPVFWEKNFPAEFLSKIKSKKVNSTLLSRFNFLGKFWRIAIILFPIYFKRLNLKNYDVVISNSASFAKWLNVDENTIHLAYVNTPPRFLWGLENSTFHKLPSLLRNFLNIIIEKWKVEDKKYAQSADLIIANSKNIQQKIKSFYETDSKIIYPPVRVIDLKLDEIKQKDFYLIVNRLVTYKHIDKVINVFNDNEKSLVIIGDGPEKMNLENLAHDNIFFTGYVDEELKFQYISRCKAIIYPGEEDFGIGMVEGLYFKKPIIAYSKGGSQEILNSKTSVLFDENSSESINDAIITFENMQFNSSDFDESFNRFTPATFKNKLYSVVLELVNS